MDLEVEEEDQDVFLPSVWLVSVQSLSSKYKSMAI